MKALLVNPPFPQTFWSFEKVLKALGKKALHPPLGLLTLAALLPTDWELKLVDLAFQRISPQDWDRSDLVLISGMLIQRQGILDIIQEGKRRGKTVVVGGPWVFHFPEEALEAGADLVVKGEGEVGVPLLLEHLKNSELGFTIRADDRADLRGSPPPRYDLLDMNRYIAMPIQFCRGCPHRCEFCDITLMLGRRVRTKDPHQILDELEILNDLGWRRDVFFVDDNFIGHPKQAKRLLRELIPWMERKNYPFEFYTQVTVDLAADEELLDLMVQAGFYKVFVGIETLEEESLKQVGKLQNLGVDIDRACQKINQAGLLIIAACIVGFDHETPGVDIRMIDFARRNHIPEMFITMLQAGEGTALWARLEAEDRLLPEYDLTNFTSNTALINFVPTRPVRDIVDEFVNLYSVLYERDFYLERAFHHVRQMTPPEARKPFNMPYGFEMRAVLATLLRQGVLYRSRFKFWKYLVTALWRFPKRVHHFLSYCVMGDHFFEFRETVRRELERQVDIMGRGTHA